MTGSSTYASLMLVSQHNRPTPDSQGQANQPTSSYIATLLVSAFSNLTCCRHTLLMDSSSEGKPVCTAETRISQGWLPTVYTGPNHTLKPQLITACRSGLPQKGIGICKRLGLSLLSHPHILHPLVE